MKKKTVLIIVFAVIVIAIAVLSFLGPISGPMPMWMSILPPLVAILMALLIKEVISSLYVGVLTGTFIMALFSGQSPDSLL